MLLPFIQSETFTNMVGVFIKQQSDPIKMKPLFILLKGPSCQGNKLITTTGVGSKNHSRTEQKAAVTTIFGLFNYKSFFFFLQHQIFIFLWYKIYIVEKDILIKQKVILI